jgi:hypothetical protein
MSDIDFHGQIPPFLRRETLPPNEAARHIVETIDRRIEWLAKRGLRPHAQVLKNKQHCLDFIAGKIDELDMERFTRRMVL